MLYVESRPEIQGGKSKDVKRVGGPGEAFFERDRCEVNACDCLEGTNLKCTVDPPSLMALRDWKI